MDNAKLKIPPEIKLPLKDIKFVPDIIIKPKPLIYNWTVKNQDELDRDDEVEKVDKVSVKYIYFVTKDDEKRTGHGRVQYGTSYFKSSKHFHLPLCTTPRKNKVEEPQTGSLDVMYQGWLGEFHLGCPST